MSNIELELISPDRLQEIAFFCVIPAIASRLFFFFSFYFTLRSGFDFKFI